VVVVEDHEMMELLVMVVVVTLGLVVKTQPMLQETLVQTKAVAVVEVVVTQLVLHYPVVMAVQVLLS
tara:strand:- start:186 stop:386 length:201 start_codon:yes stop_codon:yes gene_type:complete